MATRRIEVELVLKARDELAIALKKLGPAAGSAARDVDRELTRVATRLGTLGRTATEVSTSMSAGFGRLSGLISGRLVTAVTTAVAAFAGFRQIRARVSDALEFGEVMGQIRAILPDTGVEVAAIRDEILELAQVTGKSAAEVGRGFFEILQSGFEDASDAAKINATASKLAVAGVSEYNEAARLLTLTLNAMQIEVEQSSRVSDIWFEATRVGTTTISQMAASVGKALPLARELGVTLEETAAAMAVLTNSGFDTAESATLLQALYKALSIEGDKLREVLQRAGLAYDANTVKTLGLAGTLNVLRSVLLSTEESTDVLGARIQATQALLSLTGDKADDFAKALEAVQHATGATDKAFDLFTSQAAFRFEQFFNAVAIEGIKFGDEIIESVDEVIEEIGGLEAVQTNIRAAFSQLAPLIGDAAGKLAAWVGELPLFADEVGVIGAKVGVFAAQVRVFGSVIAGVFGNAATAIGVVIDSIAELIASIPGFDPAANLKQSLAEVEAQLERISKGYAVDLKGDDKLKEARVELERVEALLADIRAGKSVGPRHALSSGPSVASHEAQAFRLRQDILDMEQGLATGLEREAERLRRAIRDVDAAQGSLQERLAGLGSEAADEIAANAADFGSAVDDLLKAETALDVAQRQLAQDRREGRADILRQQAAAAVELDKMVADLIEAERGQQALAAAGVDAGGGAMAPDIAALQAQIVAESQEAERQEVAREIRLPTLPADERATEKIRDETDAIHASIDAMAEKAVITQVAAGELHAYAEQAEALRIQQVQSNAESEEFGRITEQVIANGVGKVSDALTDAIFNIRSFEDAIHELGRAFVIEVTRMVIQALILQKVLDVLAAKQRTVGLTTLGATVGPVGAGAGAVVGTAGEVFGFARGGIVPGSLQATHRAAGVGYDMPELRSYKRVAMARGGVLGGSLSELSGLPFRRFAAGGIATEPTLGLIREAGQNEAVIPLPDNRNVPVKFVNGGGGGSGGTTVINFSVSAVDAGSFVALLSSPSGQATIRGMLTQALLTSSSTKDAVAKIGRPIR